MDGKSVGDDEAEAAKLSWLPSPVCETRLPAWVCVFFKKSTELTISTNVM